MPLQASWLFDSGFIFSRFEQQVKTEVGGQSFAPISESMSAGAQLNVGYKIFPFLSAGAYLQYESGVRSARQLSSIPGGIPSFLDVYGGDFSETWIGPFIRSHYKSLYFEVSYGLFGRRRDDGRDDVPDINGSVQDALRTSSRVAWVFGLGSAVPLNDHFSLVLRLQYRIRYYNQRGSENLLDNVVLGTQDIFPFIGFQFD